MSGLLFKPCATLFSYWLFVYIFMLTSVKEDCVLISSEGEEKKISGWTFLVLVTGKTGPSAATVNTSRMFRLTQPFYSDIFDDSL